MLTFGVLTDYSVQSIDLRLLNAQLEMIEAGGPEAGKDKVLCRYYSVGTHSVLV